MSTLSSRSFVLVLAPLAIAACAPAGTRRTPASVAVEPAAIEGGDVAATRNGREAPSVSIADSGHGPPLEYEAFSPLYRFAPQGATFASPVTVRIAFAGDAARATVFWMNDSGVGFVPLATSVEGGFVTAEVSQLSEGFVGAQTCPSSCAPRCFGGPGSCGCTQACPGDHSRALNCDASTCVCMLDDLEVEAFDVGLACSSPDATMATFVSRCGATTPASEDPPRVGTTDAAPTARASVCSPAAGGGCGCSGTLGTHGYAAACDEARCRCLASAGSDESFPVTGPCGGAALVREFEARCGR